MRSSTSSSEPERLRVRVATKTLVAGLLLSGTVVFAFQAFVRSTWDEGTRPELAIEYLPAVAARDPEAEKVMVFGSSLVLKGFDPNEFDRRLAERGVDVVSYNFGLGNLDPRFQEIVSRRVRDSFRREGTRLALALVEFNPFQTTTARKRTSIALDEQNVATLSSPRELWDIARRNPTLGARLFEIRYVRAGVSAEMITSLALARVNASHGGRTREGSAERRRVRELNRRFIDLVQRDVGTQGLSRWTPALRGGQVDLAAIAPDTFDALVAYETGKRHPVLLEQDLANRVEAADIVDLAFDDELVAAFARIVETFETFSDHVEIVLLPRNTEWVQYSPEAEARLHAVVDSISQQTGAPVSDYQVVAGIASDSFSDTTHLNLSKGAVTFTRVLADQHAELLRNAGDEER